MSYSVCLKCEAMVGAYEKYCEDCEIKHNLKQDLYFWKTHGYDFYKEPKRSEEIKKDIRTWKPSNE